MPYSCLYFCEYETTLVYRADQKLFNKWVVSEFKNDSSILKNVNNLWIFTFLKSTLCTIKIELLCIVMIINYESQAVYLVTFINFKLLGKSKNINNEIIFFREKDTWSLYKNCTHLVIKAVLFIDSFCSLYCCI